MKTSNIFLLSTFCFVFLAMIGANLSLKNEFDKMDKNDPFIGYDHEELPAFKYIKLTGEQFEKVQVRPGKAFEMRQRNKDSFNREYDLNWKVVGDTLMFSQSMKEEATPIPFRLEFMEYSNPHVYIIAPELLGVRSLGIPVQIKGWKGVSLSVEQNGYAMLLSNNTFDTLRVRTNGNGYVKISDSNRVGLANVMVQDSSTLVVVKNIFKNFNLQADNNASASLPGSLLKRNLSL